jgi:hypothetical protein
MDTLKALFSAVWRYLSSASWFQAVQWPFWACLILLAIGGVYTARIKKNTLFCRGITGALKLTMIYLVVALLTKFLPEPMSEVCEFPFLTISETSLTLVNPLKIFDRSLGSPAEVCVRLYFLLFVINFGSYIDYRGPNPVSWFGCQVATCTASGIAYVAIAPWVNILLRKFMDETEMFYIVIAGFLLLVLFVLMTMKLYFIVFRKAGNVTYGNIMKFLTSHPFGMLFSVSFFSFLTTVVMLIAINSRGIGRIRLSSFHGFAYLLILAMCGGTLYVFSQYYTERKA